MKYLPFTQIIKDTVQGYKQDNIGTYAASVSYFTTISLVPILIFSLLIIGLFYSPNVAESQLVRQTNTVIGSQGAETIKQILSNVRAPGGGIFPFVFGIVLLIWSGSRIFAQLETALNNIWQVKSKESVGMLQKIKDKFFTFSMVGVVAFLLLISLVATVVISLLTSTLSTVLPIPGFALDLGNLIIPYLMITVMFAIVFKVLPDVIIPWKIIWIGAAFTSLLFTIAKTFIGLYLANSSIGSAYGAASSIILLLIWVFFSSQIFFIGAEFMKSYARNTEVSIRPKEEAIHYEISITEDKKRTSLLAKTLGFFAVGMFLEVIGKEKQNKVSDIIGSLRR